MDQLDQTFSGRDDLYIKVNGERVWPDGKFQRANIQEYISINKSFDLKDNLIIELMEYDYFSSDDSLGSFLIQRDHASATVTAQIECKSEGSIYELVYEVREA